MQGWGIFKEKFEKEKYIHEDEMLELVDYVCGNLNSDWSPNRGLYYRAYNHTNKLYIVINWRKAKGYPPIAKKGEMICCKKNDLVNFIKDKEHLNCCGTV